MPSKLQSQECTQLSPLQISTCTAFKKRFPTIQSVFNAYGADKWDYVLQHIDRAVNAPAPTLAQLDAIYGTNGAGKALFVNLLTAYYTMIDGGGKPLSQQATDLAARQFMGRYGNSCTTAMLVTYFASYSEFKGTLRSFDVEDVISQFGRRFLKWWGDKISLHYEQPIEEFVDETTVGNDALVELVAKWLMSGETVDDVRNPSLHGIAHLITDEILESAKNLAIETF